MKKNVAVLIFVLGVFSAINRTATNVIAGNTGAAFLNLGVGARQVGMGNAFTGIADDYSALYWNPAGLSTIDRKQFGAMHSEWIGDIRYDFIGLVMPAKKENPPQSPFYKGGTFGVSVLYLYMGEMEGRNEDRSLTGNFTSYDMAITFSYSRKINSRLNMGGNLKIIREVIEKETANGLALDMGVLYAMPVKGLTFGLNIRNAGPPMKFISEQYNLPLTVTGGVGYNLFGMINIAGDIRNQPLSDKTDLSFGAELSPVKALALRAGYLTKLMNGLTNQSAFQNQIKETGGLGLGLGFRLFSFNLDYSFSPYENFGDTHRFSLSKEF